MNRLLPGLAVLSLPLGLSAQVSTRVAASPFVPPDHWSRACLSLVENVAEAAWGVDAGAGALTRSEVARVLGDASAGSADTSELIAGCRSRLAEEYPASSATRGVRSWSRRIEGGATARYEHRRGAISTGRDDPAGWVEPAPLEDRATAVLDVAAALSASRHAALAVAVRSGPDGTDLREAYAVAAAGPLGVWAGRRRIAYGDADAAKLVLDAPEPLSGGGVFLARPLRLPRPLSLMGPLRFETMLARLERSGSIRRPWLWAMRALVQPHPRVGFAVNRAAVFGGRGTGEFGLGDFATLVAGLRRGSASRSDNQVASVEGRWLAPLEPLRPALRVEIALDDGAGAWIDVPAVAVSLEARRVPGLPGVLLGASRASFATSCCGHPPWYRHLGLPAGWSLNGVPLGHPLGGEGAEWRVHARTDAARSRLRTRASAFWRERRSENLYAPDREGDSSGGVIAVLWRAAPRLEMEAAASRETGRSGWTETHGRLSVQWLF